MKPIIGVTCCVSPAKDPKRTFSTSAEIQFIQKHYIEMVRNGGGIPVILPLIENDDEIAEICQKLDGIILTGGPEDVNPELYSQENRDSRDVNPLRDSSEIALSNEMRRLEKPVLGVCRGIQVLNASMGGVNIQDISKEIENSIPHPLNKENKEVFHMISFPERSFLTELFGNEDIRVNSSHHQSVRTAGENLRVVAIAPDGVIEAIECTNEKCTVGVQWHPERMQSNDLMLSLAKWFVKQTLKV